ncbi:MAG: hypothetical protein JW991_04475 [Candidatus Pacebacteria bacterium]|nr:hypothetical protein [Candidatus Paceibacterota bacterium]
MFRAIYFFSFIILLPVSLLLIFKPDVIQEFYSKIYLAKIESKTNQLLKTLGRALLAMTSTDAGALIIRAAGVFLGIFSLYVFFMKFLTS